MNSIERLINRCHELGGLMPRKVENTELAKILAKIIVEEKVMDEDAFEIASKAFAEGFAKKLL